MSPPDNPIKHSEIIQPGDPFKDTIRGLEKMIKLLKQAAKDYLKFAQKQNVATKEGRKNIEAVAKATKQLSIKEQEAIKLKKQLAREQAKLNLMSTREYKDLVKTREAVKAKNAAMRKSAKAMQTGTKSTNRWSKALGSFAFKFNALGNIAANVASKITQSINRAVRSAFKIVKDFDQAMADVQAVTKASAKEFDKLSKSARSLGGVTKFTATQVARLQKAYAKLGFTTEEIIKSQAATLDLAAATNTELERSAEVVGITIRQFGLNAKEATRVTDVMSKSFTTSALDMEKFAESMKFVGPAANASNISLERTTAMLAQLADAGIQGSLAGTSLRGIMLGLAKESGTLSEKIAKVSEKGLDLAGATEEVQRRAATALIVLGNGVDTIDEYTEALEDAARSTADMANVQLDTLAGQLILVTSAWEGMTIAMLATDSNLTTLKTALVSVIDTLTALAIKAETGFSFLVSLELARTTREAAEWAIEMDKADRSIDDLIDGFGKIGGWMKELGKDLWAELFPKESGEAAVTVFEDISKLLKELKKDGDKFTEEDQEAIYDMWVLPDEIVKKAKSNLDSVQANMDAAIQKEIEKTKIAQAAREEEEEATKKAEDLKQNKIQETFNLANRLTTTFTNLFATQKAKELAIFESKQERELSAAGNDAEKKAAIVKKLAEERAEIEKKFAKKEQFLAISQAIVDGASSIMKTKASLGLPAAIPFMIADAAITAAQIGIIASQKFAEGGSGLLDDSGGVLQGKRHAQGGVNLGEIGEAEKGEYFGIINRSMARKYSDELPMIFDSLNNGAFHEVWGRSRVSDIPVSYKDPWTKKTYELMAKTPIYVPDGPRKEYYPALNKTRITNG